jgi:hypothetical protein
MKDHQVQPRLSKGLHHGIEILHSFREDDVLDLFVKRRKVIQFLEYGNDGIDEMRILPLSCRVAANDGGFLALGTSIHECENFVVVRNGDIGVDRRSGSRLEDPRFSERLPGVATSAKIICNNKPSILSLFIHTKEQFHRT